MSKSKYNGVDPEAVLAKYGADTARMFILFKAPPEKDLEWDDADVEGQFRFLNRVWRSVMDYAETRRGSAPVPDLGIPGEIAPTSKGEKKLRRAIHTAIKEISEDLDGDYQLNTAVSELMKLSNAIADARKDNEAALGSPVYQEAIETLVKLLAPFAPHIAEELWLLCGNNGGVSYANWTTFNAEYLVENEFNYPISFNGKVRFNINFALDIDAADMEKAILNSEQTQKYLEGKAPKKLIIVKGKIVNVVV